MIVSLSCVAKLKAFQQVVNEMEPIALMIRQTKKERKKENENENQIKTKQQHRQTWHKKTDCLAKFGTIDSSRVKT